MPPDRRRSEETRITGTEGRQVEFDKAAILAQILRWAENLDRNADHANEYGVTVAKEMRRFVAAVVTLEADK